MGKKESLGGVVNETALGGAKLAPDDADDESDTYGFLIRDYRPQYWFHEIVTYSRKLLLGGISVVMGRGTMAQTYFVISTEAFYLMHHMRTYPFVIYKQRDGGAWPLRVNAAVRHLADPAQKWRRLG